MRGKFIEAIRSNTALFGVELDHDVIDRLADYYALVQEHNDPLHLVAPCSAEEFATRHILESLTLLEYLPKNAKFADVGAGAGLPSIPCLIARPDLRGLLIESKEKKVKFLTKAAGTLGLRERVVVVNKQFEEADLGATGFVTCRALDRFTQKLPKLIKWSKGRGFLLFGGPSLGEEMCKRGLRMQEKLMPLSERRYLFVGNPEE